MKHQSLDIERLFTLKGKVALVTGGSRGIGYMISQGLLQAGAKVYITARKQDACQQAATELSQYGDCIAIAADVASSAGREHLRDCLSSTEGHLDILVNNAGTAWGDDYENYPEQAFEKLMAINVTAVFALTRDLTPLLESRSSLNNASRIINIGSMDGLHIPSVHRQGSYAYTASKAAVHHLTRHLATELGPRNITVNAVAPGYFSSKMSDHVFDQFGDDINRNSLLRRSGEAEEMAGVAIYLCSRAGAYTHGVVIPVDGGTSINHQHVSDL